MAFIVPKPQPPTNTKSPGQRFQAPICCGRPMVLSSGGQNWQADGRPSKTIWVCVNCNGGHYTGQR